MLNETKSHRIINTVPHHLHKIFKIQKTVLHIDYQHTYVI